ncbi:MAG: 3-dehydroquinate synthase [Flavobacteriales bacterium]
MNLKRTLLLEVKSQGYSVVIGNDSLSHLNEFLNGKTYSKYFIIVDENTIEHCLPAIVTNIDCLAEAEVIQTESGEENKTIEIVTQVWYAMSEAHADRKALVVNLGGGVISDMGGFIASTYKRGIDFVNIATTLLSQVDASVGGKLGIDLGGLKNQIGVFNFPQMVVIYTPFLQTLEFRQLKSGFSEVLKHALIQDEKYWEEVKKINVSPDYDWENIIGKSVQIKNKVVLEDPKEKGIRKILNFGHTIGHAIETWHLENDPDFFLHGEAIAMGMIAEGFLSKEKLGLSDKALSEIVTVFKSVYDLKPLPEENFESYCGLMIHDKKNSGGKISCSLLSKIGDCKWDVFADKKDILNALTSYNKTFT